MAIKLIAVDLDGTLLSSIWMVLYYLVVVQFYLKRKECCVSLQRMALR